jgi:hypothetical protein
MQDSRLINKFADYCVARYVRFIISYANRYTNQRLTYLATYCFLHFFVKLPGDMYDESKAVLDKFFVTYF